MADTPQRPVTRALLRISKGDAAAALPAQSSPRSRRKTIGLRSYASFPALPNNQSSAPSNDSDPHQNTKSSNITAGRPALTSTVSAGDSSDFGLDAPSPSYIRRISNSQKQQQQLARTPSVHRSQQQSLLGCLTPTHARNMESPATQHSIHSISPSPSPTPYHLARTTHRRLTFSPADIAAAAASGSVARSGGISAPASANQQPPSLFTPPATKLVRPDPSVFTSTGLLSKKQQARVRSNSSFVTPDTPCKRAGNNEPATNSGPGSSSSDADGNNTGSRAQKGMTTPHAHHFPSAPKPPIDIDPFRLGKHRNSSTDSLRRTRKKPHLGPANEDLDDLQSLFDTPCRPRQNTLVDDEFMQRPPPGFRIPSMDAGTKVSSGMIASTSVAGASRPLPPSFAPEHQQLIESLTADNLVDPGMAPWDSRHSSNRWSWAASSDAGSVSSAATLAPNSRSPVLTQGVETIDGDNDSLVASLGQQVGKRQRQPLFRKDSFCGSIFGDDDGGTGSGGDAHCNSSREVFGGGKSTHIVDEMELDVEGGDTDDYDDDVFGGSSTRHRRGASVSALSALALVGELGDAADDSNEQLVMKSPRILAVERPQMPQIVQGCATNYPHFLGREYFCQADHSLPFLAPTSEYHVDGLGYLDYFEHQFEIISRAGEGNFSSVFSVRSLDDGQLYAVKKTRQPFTGRQERARRLREVEVLCSLPQCAGIVRLVNAWEQFGHLYIQFELCEQGNLANYLDERAHREERVSEAHAWAILAHAAHAVHILHECDVAHLDIKPANFLLGADFASPGAEQHEGWLKLADFGHAIRLPHESLAWVEEGDREYMAPEVLRGVYTKAADVFSLGMMMLEITADIVLPDNGVEWHKLREGCFDDQNFVDLPYSQDLLETIKQMLHPDLDQRPSLGQILSLSQCGIYTSARPVRTRNMSEDFTNYRSYQRLVGGGVHQQHPHALVRAASAGVDGSPMHISVHPMTTRSAAAAAATTSPETAAFEAAAFETVALAAAKRTDRKRSNTALTRRTASAPGTSPSSAASRSSAQATATAH